MLAQLIEHVRPRRLVMHDSTARPSRAGRGRRRPRLCRRSEPFEPARHDDAPSDRCTGDGNDRRFGTPTTDGCERRHHACQPCRGHVRASGRCVVEVVVRNTSEQIWPHAGALPVRLSYHVTVGDDMVVFDGIRTSLPCDVAPGRRARASGHRAVARHRAGCGGIDRPGAGRRGVVRCARPDTTRRSSCDPINRNRR